MPRGGARAGAGRKKVEPPVTITKKAALRAFNDTLATSPMLRPEEILLRVANGILSPDGDPFTMAEIDAAKALLPFSIAKPATVSIHHVNRTDARQMTDDELERIANKGSSGSGAFAASESPLISVDMVRDGARADGYETGEAPPVIDC